MQRRARTAATGLAPTGEQQLTRHLPSATSGDGLSWETSNTGCGLACIMRGSELMVRRARLGALHRALPQLEVERATCYRGCLAMHRSWELEIRRLFLGLHWQPGALNMGATRSWAPSTRGDSSLCLLSVECASSIRPMISRSLRPVWRAPKSAGATCATTHPKPFLASRRAGGVRRFGQHGQRGPRSIMAASAREWGAAVPRPHRDR